MNTQTKNITENSQTRLRREGRTNEDKSREKWTEETSKRKTSHWGTQEIKREDIYT